MATLLCKYKLYVVCVSKICEKINFDDSNTLYIWKLDKKAFINKLATNPKLCLSPQDTEIQRRCESVLNSAVTFKELRDSRGLLLDVYFA